MKKLEEEDKLTPVDATPILKKIMQLRKRSNQVERDKFKKELDDAFKSSGNIALDRAFKEGIVTKKEWLLWRDIWKMSIENIGPMLQAYFNKKDGYFKDEQIIILTAKHSSTYNHRRFFEKKFGITIQEPKEALLRMAKDKEFKVNYPKETEEIFKLIEDSKNKN